MQEAANNSRTPLRGLVRFAQCRRPSTSSTPLKGFVMRDGVLAGRGQPLNTSSDENNIMAFRVAGGPEPGSMALLLRCALAGMIWWSRRK